MIEIGPNLASVINMLLVVAGISAVFYFIFKAGEE